MTPNQIDRLEELTLLLKDPDREIVNAEHLILFCDLTTPEAVADLVKKYRDLQALHGLWKRAAMSGAACDLELAQMAEARIADEGNRQ